MPSKKNIKISSKKNTNIKEVNKKATKAPVVQRDPEEIDEALGQIDEDSIDPELLEDGMLLEDDIDPFGDKYEE